MSSRREITVRTKVIVVLIAGVFLSILSSQVHSRSLYTATWNGLYPGSSSGSNAQCAICHSSTTGGGLNDYGLDMAFSAADTISSRIVDIESLDSDSDPTSSDNLAEINANAQPGWTGWAPAGVVGDLDPTTNNQLPTADAGGPYSGTVGVALAFDGSGSSDTDGSIVRYDWDFGDGTQVADAGVTPSHTFGTAGVYTAQVTVYDDGGGTDAATATATIADPTNQAPTANAGGPYEGTAGEPVTLDASGSRDSDGTIVQYDWVFGDGAIATAAGPTPSHTFDIAGAYTVTVTVTDNDGDTDSDTTTVMIDAARRVIPAILNLLLD